MSPPPRGLYIALSGFVVAAIGAAMGFGGVYAERQWLSALGFVTTGIGVSAGAVGIVYGMATTTKRATLGSRQASREMRKQIGDFFRRR